jgi:hypothetical protein
VCSLADLTVLDPVHPNTVQTSIVAVFPCRSVQVVWQEFTGKREPNEYRTVASGTRGESMFEGAGGYIARAHFLLPSPSPPLSLLLCVCPVCCCAALRDPS